MSWNHLSGLTKAEIEVLALLAKGLNYSELASKYETTIGVMQNRLRRIYGKLGTTTRAEALLEAGRRGIICMTD